MNNITIDNRIFEFSDDLKDATFLVGENGSGKSFLLENLSKNFSQQNINVITIANTHFSKFHYRNKNIKKLNLNKGGRIEHKVIKDALIRNLENENSSLYGTFKVLDYLKFDKKIGIKLVLPNFKTIKYPEDINEFQFDDREEFISIIEKLQFISNDENRIIWYNSESPISEKMFLYDIIKVIKYEQFLRSKKAIKSIDIVLSKNNQNISLKDASSGEQTLLSTMVFLSLAITKKTVILIDEPENSLHPTWQKDYLKEILDLFSLYQPKIFIATHSPIIISGAILTSSKIKIFKSVDFEFKQIESNISDIENIYFTNFNLITPQNRKLSEILKEYLNKLIENEISKQTFLNTVNMLKELIFDKKQIELIEKIKLLADEIERK